MNIFINIKYDTSIAGKTVSQTYKSYLPLQYLMLKINKYIYTIDLYLKYSMAKVRLCKVDSITHMNLKTYVFDGYVYKLISKTFIDSLTLF